MNLGFLWTSRARARSHSPRLNFSAKSITNISQSFFSVISYFILIDIFLGCTTVLTFYWYSYCIRVQWLRWNLLKLTQLRIGESGFSFLCLHEESILKDLGRNTGLTLCCTSVQNGVKKAASRGTF